ncbi:MAG: DUF2256 domain-containing protein [Planctomycetota bacterium]|nr:DUF2256 domain-containing protein [Planctomycetota bacterium]MDG1455369.1 DUF2256 domain-containing protein [Planctomycetota bacterium]MDG2083961.1 DUF2256 domain-containing protein [Planctomycetota bacterium]
MHQKDRSNKRPLAEKRCLACGRAFSWRKKWERVWDTVKYCSRRCKANKSVVE